MIFTVANQKGGVGKTTFLINFAYYLKDFKNKSVLVIDTDTQANCSYSLCNANIIGDTYSLFTDDVNILAAKISGIKKDEINLFKSTIDLSNENEFDNSINYLQNLKYLYYHVLCNSLLYNYLQDDYLYVVS